MTVFKKHVSKIISLFIMVACMMSMLFSSVRALEQLSNPSKSLIPDKINERLDNQSVVKIITDQKTGIKMYFTDKAYQEGLSVNIEKIETQEGNYILQSPDLKECFDIKILNSKGDVIESLGGDVAVLFPVPKNFDKRENDLSVYWVKSDGKREKFDTDNDLVFLEDRDYYLFKTDHFSNWELVDNNSGVMIWEVVLLSIMTFGIIIFIFSLNKGYNLGMKY